MKCRDKIPPRPKPVEIRPRELPYLLIDGLRAGVEVGFSRKELMVLVKVAIGASLLPKASVYSGLEPDYKTDQKIKSNKEKAELRRIERTIESMEGDVRNEKEQKALQRRVRKAMGK